MLKRMRNAAIYREGSLTVIVHSETHSDTGRRYWVARAILGERVVLASRFFGTCREDVLSLSTQAGRLAAEGKV